MYSDLKQVEAVSAAFLKMDGLPLSSLLCIGPGLAQRLVLPLPPKYQGEIHFLPSPLVCTGIQIRLRRGEGMRRRREGEGDGGMRVKGGYEVGRRENDGEQAMRDGAIRGSEEGEGQVFLRLRYLWQFLQLSSCPCTCHM